MSQITEEYLKMIRINHYLFKLIHIPTFTTSFINKGEYWKPSQTKS